MQSEYVQLRRIGQELTNKIVKAVERHELNLAGKSLGLVVRGVFVFDGEEESYSLMDRAIFDIRRGNKNVVARFIEQHAPEEFSEAEQRLLEGYSKTWFSLFRVIAINPKESILELQDLINNSGPFKLIDIGLSRTSPVGHLLATRLIPIDDWCMTSGVDYPFRPHRAAELLAGLKRRRRDTKKRKYKIVPPEDYSSYFFQAYKRLGETQMRYDEV